MICQRGDQKEEQNKYALVHHASASLPVVLAQLELEGGLRHAVGVGVVLLEDDAVTLLGLGIPEEAEVDDQTRVDVLSDRAVRESVAMDLAHEATEWES